LALAAALALGVGTWAFDRATSYSVPGGGSARGPLVADAGRLRFDGGELERRPGYWVLRLAGGAWEMGLQRGRLTAALPGPSGALEASLIGEPGPATRLGFFARLRERARTRWRLRALARGLGADERLELAGLAKGRAAGGDPDAPTYTRLIHASAAVDVGARPGLGMGAGGVAATVAVAGATDDGLGLVLASMAALPGIAPGEVVLSVVRPAGRRAWAGVGAADQVGVLVGVNADGLAVAVSPSIAEDVHADAARVPVAFLARRVLEECASLDEAIKLIEATKTLGAGSFSLVDGPRRAFAVVERTPERAVVRRPTTAPPRPLVAGDAFDSAELRKDAASDRARRGYGRGGRAARLAALANRGLATPLAVLPLLRDRRGHGDSLLPPGHEGAVDDWEAGAVVIIDPAAMMLWLGLGPGAAGAFSAVDLRAELHGEPVRVLAPEVALVPALAEATAEAADRVRRAQSAVASSARALRAGDRRLAGEFAARAVVLAPELPGPWLALARAARAALGDAAEATVSAYREVLARSPADGEVVLEAQSKVPGGR
jgi:hypothetical protein